MDLHIKSKIALVSASSRGLGKAAAKSLAKEKISLAELMVEISKEIPAGRLGNLEEVGDVIAFLASENAGYINGVNLLVDGGLVRGID